jgi:hypothetical protein
MKRILLFLAVVGLTSISSLTGCVSMKVHRSARRAQVAADVLRLEKDLVYYDIKRSKPRSVRYYSGTKLVCIIDRDGTSWHK